jgi:hypothetical protein
MNDEDLKKRLAELGVPEPDETARERALDRALTALRNTTVEAEVKRPAFFARWAILAGTCAVLALTVVVGSRPAGDDLVVWQRTLREVEALFPGQLTAVIESDGAVDLEISDEAAGGTSQPVLVEFTQGSRVLRVLSYSGRRVCVDLGGEKACFEPLVTSDGGVILAGENFLWSAENPASPGGYRVQARFLNPAS